MHHDDLQNLADAVSLATGIPIEELFCRNKTLPYSMARGVFFMLAREYCSSLTTIAKFSQRHHTTCHVLAERYRGYYESKDKQVCLMVEAVMERMNK